MERKYPIRIDGDPTKEVVLEYSGDYNPYWELSTQRYRSYKDYNGNVQSTKVGKEHQLCRLFRAFGKLFFVIEKSTFEDTGLKAWERGVFFDAREDFPKFLRDNFGLTITELEFPEYISPTGNDYHKKDTWDWMLEIPDVEFISHRDQCESKVKPIQNVLDAQVLLVEHGFKALAGKLNSELESRQKRMEKALHFDKVLSDTRMSDIPQWVWDDEREVCKRRKAKIAKEFEHILEKKVVF